MHEITGTKITHIFPLALKPQIFTTFCATLNTNPPWALAILIINEQFLIPTHRLNANKH